MLTKASATCAIATVLMLYAGSACATVITDPALYSDLATDTSQDLAGFAIAGSAGGPADLSLRFGQWSGVPGILDLIFTFNGTELTPLALSTGAYYSTPAYVNYDVTTLLTTGLNTLSVFGTFSSGGPATYAIGEATLEYSTSVSEPGSLALLGLGLSGLLVSIRRKQTNS